MGEETLGDSSYVRHKKDLVAGSLRSSGSTISCTSDESEHRQGREHLIVPQVIASVVNIIFPQKSHHQKCVQSMRKIFRIYAKWNLQITEGLLKERNY